MVLLGRNYFKLDELFDKLANTKGLTPGQIRALNDEIILTRLGIADNAAGVIGGVSEVVALHRKSVFGKKAEAKFLQFEGLAALAGSIAAGMNAWQNFEKASGKAREGDQVFRNSYAVVGAVYVSAAAALFSNAAALFAKWLATRGLIRIGGWLLAVVEFGVTKLSAIGWGVTVVAFVSEGVVNYKSRTPIEAWVEQCAFGVSPITRSAADERAAYEKAVLAMREQAISQTDAVPTS